MTDDARRELYYDVVWALRPRLRHSKSIKFLWEMNPNRPNHHRLSERAWWAKRYLERAQGGFQAVGLDGEAGLLHEACRALWKLTDTDLRRSAVTKSELEVRVAEQLDLVKTRSSDLFDAIDAGNPVQMVRS